MRTLLLIAFIFGFVAGLAVSSVMAQSEHLDDPVNYQALELRLAGCQNNLPLYFHACNKEAWQKFFGCTGLYPRQTLTEQLDNELGCARGD